MADNMVSVVGTGDGVETAVRKSVELIGGLKMVEGEHVVIKPNVCNAKNPYGMVNTDARVLESIVDLVRDKAGRITVVESDNISGTAETRMENSGILEVLDRLGVGFLNLSKDNYEVHEVAGIELRLPRTVLDADFFVNLPKIKTCGHTLVTLSIKNLFGVIQRRRKNRLHGRLDEVLPYLARTIRSDLIVVDGVTAMEGNGPVIGTPREMGVIVAGSNPVSVDSVCSAMMGFDPAGIAHIAKAHKMGLGELDPERIEVVGDDWRSYAGEFERPYSLKATIKSVRTIGKVYF